MELKYLCGLGSAELSGFIAEKANELLEILNKNGQKIAFAESCTGGMLAESFTAQAGASAVFEGSFVTYSNRVKSQILGIDGKLIEAHTAVSAQVASEMAICAKNKLGADVSASVTGYAGPSGADVGTVFVGICAQNTQTYKLTVQSYVDAPTRTQIRQITTAFAFAKLVETLK